MTDDSLMEKLAIGGRPLSVLLTNDDGYRARGITTLADYLDDIADVHVVAPRGNRSGVGTHITFGRDRADEQKTYRGREVVAVDGYPCDCVRLALDELYGDSIDVVVSGINRGRNLGNDLVNSGTISAARDACLPPYNRVGIAVSAGFDEGEQPAYNLAAEFCSAFLTFVAGVMDSPGGRELLSGYYFSLNVPLPAVAEPSGQMKGVALTYASTDALSRGVFETKGSEETAAGTRTRRSRHWKRGPAVETGSDSWAIEQGYLSLCPVYGLGILGRSEPRDRRSALDDLIMQEFSFRGERMLRFSG